MPTINQWLTSASQQLKTAGIASSQLDAEIILAHTLRRPRIFLHAHNEDLLEPRQHEIADARLMLRLDRTPIAYIIGHKEFYGRRFKVTPATLIPRPESEVIIELLGKLLVKHHISLSTAPKLIDIGTGSGCLGITAKREFPQLDVTLSDVSRHALTVAKHNADALKADVQLLQSDLLNNYPFTPAIIVANLPYVDVSWQRSPETDHEPPGALFAPQKGLGLITALITQAAGRMKPGGLLLLEADPRQFGTIIHHASANDFYLSLQRGFIIGFIKGYPL